MDSLNMATNVSTMADVAAFQSWLTSYAACMTQNKFERFGNLQEISILLDH
jgi:hypothetical protein